MDIYSYGTYLTLKVGIVPEETTTLRLLLKEIYFKVKLNISQREIFFDTGELDTAIFIIVEGLATLIEGVLIQILN